jgi:hypothetical protein
MVAVLGGSPAIDAGDQAVCAAAPVNSVDQRGFMRPGGGFSNCTIGAYEFGGASPGLSVPALSLAALFGLGLLLTGAGWLSVQRRARR